MVDLCCRGIRAGSRQLKRGPKGLRVIVLVKKLKLTSTSGVLGAFFILYCFLILVTIAEIVLYAFSYLHSGLYLFFQIVKTSSSICIWTVLFLYPFVVLDSSRQPIEASIFMGAICVFLQ